MKLRSEQWLNIRQALLALDQPYEKLIEEGRSKKIMNARFEFSKAFRIKLGGMLHQLQGLSDSVQREQDNLLRKYGGVVEGEFRVQPEKWPDWNEEKRELLDAEVSLDLDEIGEDDLKLDANPIPVSVLALLQPVMAGVEDARPAAD